MKSLCLYAVGDCNTEGFHALPKEDNIPEQLSSIFKASGQNIQLINLGHTMTTTREGLDRVRNEVQSPDYLLINFGLVDAWVTSIPQVYIPYYPDNRFRKLGRKILKTTKKRLRHKIFNALVSRGEVVSPKEYVHNIDEMIRIARCRNSEVKILLWGTTFALNNPQRNVNIRRYNELLKDLSRSRNTLFLDIEEIVDSLPIEEAYLDDVHLSARSSVLIAARMNQLLM